MAELESGRDVSSWVAERGETLGTKRKVWLREPGTDAEDGYWLFKYRYRPTTGDDWAEALVARVAALLGIPHAEVELAVHCGAPGVISRDFTHARRAGELILGNALLVEADPGYPGRSGIRVGGHTIERVFRTLSGVEMLPPTDFMPRGTSKRPQTCTWGTSCSTRS